ncbi:AraC family transcriptional regulator [Dysgonomonas sp. 520]|uniref:AraC family transcriptional regulator n=1 Tax=Dysgonomonas sp. 520 TaxID=2302931 RepID=UPI0013D2625A|nr:AraC family transcriptional regulator [Dysgonomonas sp. 520]NDW11181.1 AraC family transcriptional regulator [Dysgonomonas sp. 520]
MERFLSISPSPLLAPYVKEYWFLSADSTCQGKQRAIPSGYAGLIFNQGGNIYSEEYGLFPKSYLFGQSVSPINMCFDNLNIVIVVFQPIGIKMLLDISGNELKGQNVGLDLLSPQLKELETRLLDTFDEQKAVDLIENFLLGYLNSNEDYNYKRFISVIQSIEIGENNISKLADRACLGYKQFKRLFLEYVGLNPKEFIQINRFSKTLHLLQTDSSANLNEIACKCGYYDKSHLIREVKFLSGYTPNEFLSNADPYSDNRSLFQSFFVDIKNISNPI